MIADLFWNAATSHISLTVLAVLFVAALIVGHVPVIDRLLPSLAPYVVLARVIAYVALAAGALCLGFRIADERAETRRLKNDLAFKQMQIEDAEATAEDAKKLKEEADAKAAEAKGMLDDFRSKYGDDPTAACAFTPDDLERLRNLRRAEPKQPVRAPFPRLRAIGGERR
jgi:hypothetical protein